MSSKNKNQGEMFPRAEPESKTGANGCNKEMNRIFYDWLMDHTNDLTSRRGEMARKLRGQNIFHTDATFPKWHDYERIQ